MLDNLWRTGSIDKEEHEQGDQDKKAGCDGQMPERDLAEHAVGLRSEIRWRWFVHDREVLRSRCVLEAGRRPQAAGRPEPGAPARARAGDLSGQPHRVLAVNRTRPLPRSLLTVWPL